MLAMRQIMLGPRGGASMPTVDGIMMIGWSINTGLRGLDATSSFGVEAEMISPFKATTGELDFVGNYFGSAAATLLLGINGGNAYAFCIGSNRAPSVSAPIATTINYKAVVDYSGSVSVEVNGTQKSESVSTDAFASNTYQYFLVGCGGLAGDGYVPAPVVIKRVKFTLDGVIAADYTPTISGGKIGMQDTVRGTFASAPAGGATLAYMEALT